ncbi:MAG: AI-2E family transporter [Acidobacteria bacterium]|nr:AI-2E family transporter [Acidobacteriota bacterium]
MVGGIGYFLFFLVAFLTLTILLIWPVFPYVVLGILLTYLFHPLEKRLQKVIPSPSVRAGLLTLLATLVITFPLVYAIQRLTRELGSQAHLDRMRQLLENARNWLNNHQAQLLANWMAEMIEQGRNFLLGNIPNLFGSVFSIILGIFVCLFVFYYFTKEGEHLWQALMNVIPLPNRLKSQLNQEVTGIVRAIFYGQLVTAIVQGSVGGIGLVIFQVPQPFLLTALMILLSFLPFVGAPLVWVPAGVLKLMAGQTWQGLGLLIYGAVLVLNIDNVIRPRLIALHSQVHPVVILIGIIGGTEVFGFIGFLVGPVIFAIFLRLLRFFAEYRPAEMETPVPPSVRV